MTNLNTCSIEDCEKPPATRGWCHGHYKRWLRTGDPIPRPKPKPVKICAFPECGRKDEARGLCEPHAAQKRKGQELKPIRGFGLPMSERYEAKVIKGDGCWGWSGHLERGYATTGARGKSKWAHRVSWEIHNGPIPDGMTIDHICHTKECTRPDHLRLATYKQNNENQAGPQARTTTGYRGVHYRHKTGKWLAHVSHNKKYYHVGLFDTAEDAAQAATDKRNELFTHNAKDRAD